MGKPKKVLFQEYRYQILPTSQHVQLNIDGTITSMEQLKAKKNELFLSAIAGIGQFEYSRGEIRHKPLLVSESMVILQIGVERDLKRQTREFEVEEIENWPTVVVALQNDPTVQKCMVQERGGFQNTGTVVRIIEQSVNKVLAQYQLAVVFEPIYQERYFWDLVGKYEGKITQIEFELISPNMSNISSTLKIDLRALTASTNTQRTNLQLNSDAASSLTPSEDDPMVKGLAEYSSQGGGDISVRVRGMKGKIHTSKGINEYEIDEMKIQSATAEELATIFQELMG